MYPGDIVLELADYLFEREEYEAAVTEYKRYLYFNNDSELCPAVLLKIGKAFRESGDWEAARHYFDSAEKRSGHSSEKCEARIQKALISMGEQSYTKAEFELQQISSLPDLSPEASRKISLHLGILYTYTGRWHKAGASFTAALDNRPELLRRIQAVLLEASAAGRKKPGTAKVLSTLLPGLGQFYSGAPADGVSALLINGGIFFLFGYAVAEKHYPEAALTFAYLILRFYPGSIYQAGQKAEAKNSLINWEYQRRIFAILKDEG